MVLKCSILASTLSAAFSSDFEVQHRMLFADDEMATETLERVAHQAYEERELTKERAGRRQGNALVAAAGGGGRSRGAQEISRQSG